MSNPSGVQKAWVILALLFGIIAGVSSTAFMDREANLTEVVCTANVSSFLLTEGWLRLYDADRGTVTRLVGQGRATMKREDTLICYDSRPFRPYRVVVSEWWWRRSP